VNAVRFLYAKEYPKSKLSFRNANFDIQYFASQIEDSFITLINAYPKNDSTLYQKFKRKVNDTGFDAVMISAAESAESVRKKFPTPEDFIIKNNIPIFPIQAGNNGFDGFLISIGQHQAICLNVNKPPNRIRFTLCHEISHLLYDQNINVPIDTFFPHLYRDIYSPDEIPEFFAYKFAQFYLLPFSALKNHVVSKWPNLDNDKLQRLLEKQGASVDVLINVLFDIIRLNDGLQPKFEKLKYQDPSSGYHKSKRRESQFDRMDYEEGRNDEWSEDHTWYEQQQITQRTNRSQIKQYCSSFKSSTQGRNIYSFLNGCHDKNRMRINKIKNDYSKEVLNFILETLQLEL
jgi:Zn-dependent peptidase ImmA (M78 family)